MAAPVAPAKKQARVDTFVCAPEKHVSVDSHELKQAIKNRLELEERVVFDDLCKLMEGVANFDFFDLKQRMRKNFLPFASGARNSIYLQRSSKALPTTPVLDQKQDEFIADVYEVLRASHYTLLTKEEWDLATSENFNLNLPMEVNWDYMDKDLLTKFWASTPERAAIRTALPDAMADRILVFHRGIGTEKLSGLLIDQKLDLLMDYTVFAALDKVKKPVMDVLDKVLEKVLKKKKKAGEEAAQVAPAAAPAAAAGVVPDGAAMDRYEFDGNIMIGSKHKFARSIERNTLARACPTLLTLLKSFPTKLELQEPTFKDLVVVYRRALPPRQPPTASSNAPNKSKDERMQGILSYRNINIKVFGETPMADVEMIFPEKIVGIKPFQLVNLAVTLITALITGALVLWKAGSDINMNIVWTAASLVLTRCFSVYNTAQTQRTLLQQQMTSALYDKMQDSQEGVVSVIMEEMADQQMKQMLLAFMLLVIKDRALLAADLDSACEDFLFKEFDHPIDYDLDAALPRLKRWGLVTENAQGKLEALPMPEAISVLEAAWATAYKVIGTDAAVPTMDMITGAYSVFGEGIDRFVRERDAAAAASEGSGGAKGAKGMLGKASGGISGGFTAAGAGLSAGFGKAKGILPFSKSSGSTSGGAGPSEGVFKASNSKGSFAAAAPGANGSTAGLTEPDMLDAAAAAAAYAYAAAAAEPLAAADGPYVAMGGDVNGNSSSTGVVVNGDDAVLSPVGSRIASPASSYGGAAPAAAKKKSSLKNMFKKRA